MASGSLGNLTVDLLLEAASWATGLNKADYEAKQFAEKLERKFNKLADGVGSAFKKMAVGIAAGFAVDQIAGFVNEVQKAADALGELAEKTGTSVEFMAEMSILAATSGTSVEALASSMSKFGKATVQAFGDKNSQPAKVFKELGVSVEDSNGKMKSSEQLYKEVAQAMGELEDGAVKSAAAQILFGKSGADLIPLMNAQARQSVELKAATKAYGAEIAKLAPIAGELENQQAIASATSKTWAAVIGQQLIPYFSKLLEQWNSLSTTGSGFAAVGTVLLNMFKGLVIAIDATATVLMSLGTIIFGVVRAYAAFTSGDFTGAFNLFTESLKDANSQGAAFEERVKKLLDPLGDIPPAAKKGKEATDGLTDAVRKLGKEAKDVKIPGFIKFFEDKDFSTKPLDDLGRRIRALDADIEALAKARRDADNAFYGIGAAAELAAEQVGMTRQEIELYNARLKLLDAAQKALKMDEFAEQWERLQKAIADKQAREDYLKWLNTLEGEWHRAFDAMFNETEGGWEGMLKSLKQSFKKLLLDYIYQQFAKPFFMNVVMKGGGGGGGFDLSSIFNANSGGSDLFSMFGGGGGGNSFLSNLFGSSQNGIYGPTATGGNIATPGFLSGSANPWGGAGYAVAGIAGGAIGGWGAGALGAGERGQAAGQQWGSTLATIGMMTPLGPIGAAIGAALGAVIGKATDPDPDAMRAAHFGSLAGAEGVTPWTGQSAFGSFGFSQGEWLSDSDMGEQMEAFVGGLEQMDNAFAAFMSEDQIARVTARLNEASSRYELGMEHGGVTGLAAIAKDRLTIITREIDEGLGQFVEAFEGNTEDLVAIINSYLALRSGEDFDVDEIIESLKPKGMMEAYQEQAGAFDELIANADGTAESMSALTTGMANFQLATVEMVMAIDKAAASIHEMFMSTAENIELSTMSDEQKYGHFQSSADALYDQLLTETDPAKIEELSRKINEAIGASWALLDDEQKAALKEQFLAKLKLVDQTVADKLKGLRDVVVEDAEDAMTKVTEKLDALFAKADVTADKNSVAADKNLKAAETPVEVVVVGGGIVTDSGGG